MATALLELLSIANFGQQHIEGSSNLKDVKNPSFSLQSTLLCIVCMQGVGFHSEMYTHLHTCKIKELFYFLHLSEKWIKAIEFY